MLEPPRHAAFLAALALACGVLASLGGFGTFGPAGAQGRLESFERAELSIETAAGARHRFRVELALTPAQQAQGLMYRRHLAEDAGMLFLHQPDTVAAMWMRNTLIPLDMLFIARDGTIVHVAERTVPHSLETISAERPVAGVLELNGGTAARLGIAVGDRVLHPAFADGS